VLFGITHHITIDGILRVRLFADTTYFYQGSQTAELHGVQVEFYSPEGRLSSTVRSREGTYYWRTQEMEARRDVVGTSPDGRRLETSILRYDRTTEQISGPNSFVFDAPDRHLEGDGFTADPDLTRIEAVRPRRGRIQGAEVRRP
jgi:LPS export ABC transporter protein LptC